MNTVFQTTPLSLEEWFAVLKLSIPVILIDETLKFIARKFIDVAPVLDEPPADKKRK
jgi:Ca2+ transporting ATPase